MALLGWSRSTLRAGDVITAYACIRPKSGMRWDARTGDPGRRYLCSPTGTIRRRPATARRRRRSNHDETRSRAGAGTAEASVSRRQRMHNEESRRAAGALDPVNWAGAVCRQLPPVFFRTRGLEMTQAVPNVNSLSGGAGHPIVQGDIANPNLEVRLCLATKPAREPILQPYNADITYVMSLLCQSRKPRDHAEGTGTTATDLSGLATIRPRTRVSGSHLLAPDSEARRRLRGW